MKILLLGDMSPTSNNFEYFDKMDTETLFNDTKLCLKATIIL